MKARVKETGAIVSVEFVEKKFGYSGRWIFFYEDGEGRRYKDNELDFDNTDNTPEDYWTRLEHTYAGMAMQGILSCPEWNIVPREGVSHAQECALQAQEFAHALVEKMKNQSV